MEPREEPKRRLGGPGNLKGSHLALLPFAGLLAFLLALPWAAFERPFQAPLNKFLKDFLRLLRDLLKPLKAFGLPVNPSALLMLYTIVISP